MAASERVKDKNNNGKVDPQEVYNYLTQERGVSSNHALGMIANINTESGWNPSIVGDGGNAIGLFQHNGPRKAALLKYVNGDTTNWKKQIDFALSEQGTTNYLNKNFTTPEAATEHFMVHWERPGNQSRSAIAGRQQFLNTFSNGEYVTPGYQAQNNGSEEISNQSIPAGQATQFLTSNPSNYSQQASNFKEDIKVENEKLKKEETDPATKELTAAEKEHNVRINFLNMYNSQNAAVVENPLGKIEVERAEQDPTLYKQDIPFELADQTTPLFKTSLESPEVNLPTQEFKDGGRKQSLADLTIGDEYHYAGRPDKSYKLNDSGEWMIRSANSKDNWKVIKDPTGSRSATLERTVMPKSEYLEQRKMALNKELGTIKGQGNQFYLPDTRTMRATTGQAIRPNVDLMGGDYSEDVVKEIITKARAKGVDPKTALAIALQESHLGKIDTNLGHSLVGGEDPYSYMDILKSKVGLAKSKGYEDELTQLQFYNGTGKLYPGTEKDYHGFVAGKFYGVPVTSEGLDMLKNPLYGKQIIDLRDNVIGKSKHIDSLLNVKSFAEGGISGEGDPDIYTYSGRPGSTYQKDASNNWLIKNKDTNGVYAPIKDPTGERTKNLNTGAVKQDAPKNKIKVDSINSQIIKLADSVSGGGYNKAYTGSGTPFIISHSGEEILPAATEGTYCSGYTCGVAMKTLEERGLLKNLTSTQLKDFQKTWYGAKNFEKGKSETLSTKALEDFNLGKGIGQDEAKAGDIAQIWRSNGSGHSVIFKDWVTDPRGNRIGIKYRSSQSSTNGIGDRVEIFNKSIDPKRIYIARLNDAKHMQTGGYEQHELGKDQRGFREGGTFEEEYYEEYAEGGEQNTFSNGGPPKKNSQLTLDDYLKVYESSLQLESSLNQNPDYKLSREFKLDPAKNNWLKDLETANSLYEGDNKTNAYYKKVSPYGFYQKEISNGYLNEDLPSVYYDSRISPTLQHIYDRDESTGKPGDRVQLYRYDSPTVREQALKNFQGSEEQFAKLDAAYRKQPEQSITPVQENIEPNNSELNKEVNRGQIIIPGQSTVAKTMRVPVQGVEDYWVKDPVLGNVKRQRPVTTWREVPYTDEVKSTQGYNIQTGSSTNNSKYPNGGLHVNPWLYTYNQDDNAQVIGGGADFQHRSGLHGSANVELPFFNRNAEGMSTQSLGFEKGYKNFTGDVTLRNESYAESKFNPSAVASINYQKDLGDNYSFKAGISNSMFPKSMINPNLHLGIAYHFAEGGVQNALVAGGPPIKNSQLTLDDYLKVYESALKLENALKQNPDYVLSNDAKLGNKNNWIKELEKAQQNSKMWDPSRPFFKQMITNPAIPKDTLKGIIEESKNYKPNEYYENISPYSFEQRELSLGYTNKEFPRSYYDRRISPTYQSVYERPASEGKHRDRVEVYRYDAPTVREQALKNFQGSEEQFAKLDASYAFQPKPSISNTKIDTLPLRPIPGFSNIEQTIIPGKQQIKPFEYKWREWKPAVYDGKNLDMPEGYTQEDVEKKIRQLQRDEFTRRTLEYQNQQRNFAEGGITGEDGPEIYTYSGRPGSTYQKDENNNWLIKNKDTNGKYVPIKDPTGSRAKTLNAQAKPSDSSSYNSKSENVPNYFDKTRPLDSPFKEYGPQSAGSADWFWTLPIAGTAALKAAGSIGAMSLPGMAAVPGATVGNLANAAAIGHGITKTPETIKAWDDVSKGKKKWQDAALETGINLSEFAGAGSGVKSLVQDINQGIKATSNYGKDLAYVSKEAGRFKFPTYQPVTRWDPDYVPSSLQQAGKELSPEQQALTGSWYSYKPKGSRDYEATIGFYPSTRPGSGNINHLRLSEREIANLEKSMSNAAKGMSGKNESVTTSNEFFKGELNLPQDLRDRTQQIRFEVNPSEYIPQSYGLEPRSNFGQGMTGQHIVDVVNSQYPKIMGIPRQYVPFREGGVSGAVILDSLLDQNNINAFKQKYGL